MMELDFNGYQVHVINEDNYTLGSADNIFQYCHIYQDDKNCRNMSLHGIRIYQDGELINSALVASWGGYTTIHKNSFTVVDNSILICCGCNVFCLFLPSLELLWHTKADDATCFEIFSITDGFIVHGELEISRLDKDGNIVWQVGGADIFVRQNVAGGFEIKESSIIATDWNNDIYEIGFDGEIISHTVKQ